MGNGSIIQSWHKGTDNSYNFSVFQFKYCSLKTFKMRSPTAKIVCAGNRQCCCQFSPCSPSICSVSGRARTESSPSMLQSSCSLRCMLGTPLSWASSRSFSSRSDIREAESSCSSRQPPSPSNCKRWLWNRLEKMQPEGHEFIWNIATTTTKRLSKPFHTKQMAISILHFDLCSVRVKRQEKRENNNKQADKIQDMHKKNTMCYSCRSSFFSFFFVLHGLLVSMFDWSFHGYVTIALL